MKFITVALSSLISASLVASAAIPEPQATDAPSRLVKRSQKILSDAVWRTTSSKIIMAVTPTVIDGVTISASPVTSTPTPWASLDSSGIPYIITPTVKDGTTVSASPTPTNTNVPTPSFVPPVLRCFGDRVPSSDSDIPGYPFCTAANGTEMIVGETYWLTWDPTYWGGTDVTKVKIELIPYPQTGSNTLLVTNYLSNTDGFYPLTIESSYIRDGNGYMWVTITPLTTSTTDATNTGTKNGPLIRAIASKSDASKTINRVPSDSTNDSSSTTTSTSTSSKKSNNAKTIAPAVIVPVIAVLAIGAFVIWYLKNQKKNATTNKDSGEIQLSPSSTVQHENASIITSTTAETQNPFKETSRTVL